MPQPSAATAKVLTAGTPAVSGIARVGSTLTASAGTWTASTVFTYRWYADGVAIAGATKSTFVLTSAQDSKAISVRVTGTKSGYADGGEDVAGDAQGHALQQAVDHLGDAVASMRLTAKTNTVVGRHGLHLPVATPDGVCDQWRDEVDASRLTVSAA